MSWVSLHLLPARAVFLHTQHSGSVPAPVVEWNMTLIQLFIFFWLFTTGWVWEVKLLIQRYHLLGGLPLHFLQLPQIPYTLMATKGFFTFFHRFD